MSEDYQNMQALDFQLSLSGKYIPLVRNEHGQLQPVSRAPISLSQAAFLAAPEREVISVGPRGTGKTDAGVMDFCSQVGKGFGSSHAGIVFRHTQSQLRDVEKLSSEIIKPIWPSARYNSLKAIWTFPDGATLEFFHMTDLASDFDNIHGRQFSWVLWEELQNWKSLTPFLKSFSVLRSTALPGLMRRVRATANPLGPNHNNIKHRYRLRGVPEGVAGPAITDSLGIDGEKELPRRAIYSDMADNVLLRRNEPDYYRNLVASCQGDEARLLGWTKGSWDAVSGGAFDDLFLNHRDKFVLDPFEIPPSWPMFYSYDHGSSKPASFGIWAESDGCNIIYNGAVRSTRRGDLYRVGEVYLAAQGKPDVGLKLPISEIVRAFHEYKIRHGYRWQDHNAKWHDRVKSGVADSSIFDKLNEFSVAGEMEKPVKINGVMHPGLTPEPADKGPFSRRTGFQLFRQLVLATAQFPREERGFYVIGKNCPDFMRTIPVLQRSEKDLDDIENSSQEDHIWDETRYALRFDRTPFVSTRRRQLLG